MSRRQKTPPLFQEKHFLQQIIDLATLYGWLHYHQYDSRMSTAGLPDLILLHPVKHRFLVRELKMEGEYPTPAQRTWLTGMLACGLDVGVWYPHDWEQIVATLSAA